MARLLMLQLKYRVIPDNLQHQEWMCYRDCFGTSVGPKGFLHKHKTMWKCLFGQKYILIIGFKTSQETVCQKEEFQGLVIWGLSGRLKIHFFFLYLVLNIIKFKIWLLPKFNGLDGWGNEAWTNSGPSCTCMSCPFHQTMKFCIDQIAFFHTWS